MLVRIMHDTDKLPPMRTCKILFWGTAALAVTLHPALSQTAPPPGGQQAPVIHRPVARAKWHPTADTAAIPNYLYITRFRRAVAYPLRAAGSSSARQLYTCPPKAAVYVLRQSAGFYTNVAVNGRVGYVPSRALADIR